MPELNVGAEAPVQARDPNPKAAPTMQASGTVTMHHARRFTLVEVIGDIDTCSDVDFARSLTDAADTHHRIIIDLTGVTHFSDSGVNCISLATDGIHTKGGKLCLVCPQAGIAWPVIATRGLYRRWNVHHSLDEAILCHNH